MNYDLLKPLPEQLCHCLNCIALHKRPFSPNSATENKGIGYKEIYKVRMLKLSNGWLNSQTKIHIS